MEKMLENLLASYTVDQILKLAEVAAWNKFSELRESGDFRKALSAGICAEKLHAASTAWNEAK